MLEFMERNPVRGRTALVKVLVAAAVSLLLAGCTQPGGSSPGPIGGSPPALGDTALRDRVVDQVSGASATEHLDALQRIADANGGNRTTPSPGYDASVDYVAGVLRDAGFDVTVAEFTFESDGDRRGGRRSDDSEGGEDTAEVTGRSVIAQTRTGDPDNVVMAGAHLDSVPDGPGINDNGTGVAALLELATQLGGSPPVTNALRFAFWGAEENGFYGSQAYVDDLPDADIQALALYVNLDMLGSPNGGYFVQGGTGEDEDETGPTGSAAVGRVLADQFAAVGAPPEPSPFEGGSDYVAFLDAGVPTGGVYAGDEVEKSARQARQWGGQEGEVYDSCYHSACDTTQNVDATIFDRSVDAVAGSMIQFATAPS